MSSFRIGVVVCLFGLAAAAAHAQSSAAAAESASAAPPVENGIPIARLVSQVGHETHKKFVIDPHIRADIALGDLNPSELSYSDLQEIPIAVVQLVPILRPMIPQYGHLAALPCVNKLIMVDTYANVRRIESVIEALDVGEPYQPEKCGTPHPPEKP